MKRTQTVFMALLLLAPLARAQDAIPLELKGDVAKVKVARQITVYDERSAVKSFPFTISIPVPGAIRPDWEIPAGVVATKRTRELVVTAAPKGELTIRATWGVVTFNKETMSVDSHDDTGVLTFIVGDAAIPPAPPVPVPPNPPKPPVPTAGLRVLVVAEATNGGLLFSQKQINELYGEKMADYTRAKLAKGPDGTPEIRRIDKDADISKMNPVWKEFFAVWQKEANGVVPWIIVSNGVAGFSGPLPDGGGAILEIIRRYEP